MSPCDGGRPKNIFKYNITNFFCTPTDPVPPNGDPSEDAQASTGKLRKT